jgi:hypothetical protein
MQLEPEQPSNRSRTFKAEHGLRERHGILRSLWMSFAENDLIVRLLRHLHFMTSKRPSSIPNARYATTFSSNLRDSPHDECLEQAATNNALHQDIKVLSKKGFTVTFTVLLPKPQIRLFNSNFYLISTHHAALPCQCLKHPRRQLVPNQPGKNHQILRLLEQLLRKRLARWILIRPAE